MGSYFVIVTCRNSENEIEGALKSLVRQSAKWRCLIVVNDGSTDQTATILREFQAKRDDVHIINNPDMGYNIGRVVANWNAALRYAKQLNLQTTDYHMISTDDTLYEETYCEKIIKAMDDDPLLAIASGTPDTQDYVTPRGAGRFIRNSFFSSVHGYYPERMGYESLILHTAVLNGFRYTVIPGAKFTHTRTLGSNHHFYEFGASMRTLGYHPLFVLGRFAKYFSSGKPLGRLGAVYMLYHYLSYRPVTEGYDSMYDTHLRNSLRRMQIRRIRRYLLFGH